jgi:hypothetical protein
MVCGLQIENQYFKQPFLSEQFATNLRREIKAISDMATFAGVVLDLRWNSLDICIKKERVKTPFLQGLSQKA